MPERTRCLLPLRPLPPGVPARRGRLAAVSRVVARVVVPVLGAWLGLAGLPGIMTAQAQGSRNAAGIYTCTDAQGRKLTSDRPIAECTAREQRVLNADGSLRQVLPPTLTAEERAAREAQEHRLAQQRASQADALRRDRNLLQRYPNEDKHQQARQVALEPVRLAIKASERRLASLAQERKRLDDEAEFYRGRAVPASLRQQLDANDATVEAQRAATRNQEAELDRINALYDAELERLRRLWAGAAPGSLPPLPAETKASAPAPKAKPR